MPRALAMSLVLGGLAAVGCGADDAGVHVSLALDASGDWLGTEQVDHVTLLATSGTRTAVACFGATSGSSGFVSQNPTANPIDPCADETSLRFTDPPTLSMLAISTGSLTANLEFPDGDEVQISAFLALAGGAVIGRKVGSASDTATSSTAYPTRALFLTKETPSPTPAACTTGLRYFGSPTDAARVACGTAGTGGCVTFDPNATLRSGGNRADTFDGRVECNGATGGFTVHTAPARA